MKKIFAILISLLFLLSTFGFASAAVNGGGYDCCDPEYFDISKTSVKVGETFTVTLHDYCLPCLEGAGFENPCDVQIVWSTLMTGPPEFPFPPGSPIERVGVKYLGDNKYAFTLRAVRPGEVVFGIGCGMDCYITPGCIGDNCEVCNQICNCTKTVTISSRGLPMDWIMKKFGLGNKFKE